MANELLDFVMGLVRDPEAAARYAADPSSAIADAHLTNVTSADVNNLIPMVSDSLSMAAPAFGTHDALEAFDGGNVWTSGAATAAFDAFETHLPEPAIAAVQDFGGVIDTSLPVTADTGVGTTDFDLGHETSAVADVAQFSDVIDDPAAHVGPLAAEDPSWDFGAADADLQHGTDGDSGHAGFDIFS